MGWRKLAHAVGFDMTRHLVLHKGEVRLELCTAPDGEALQRVALYKFGDLVVERRGEHGDMVSVVRELLKEHAP